MAEMGRGLPLGNLTSQLLVNIYMNEFDQFVKRELKVKYYIRYADDFVILQNDKIYLQNLLPKISRFLKEKLKLQLQQNNINLKKKMMILPMMTQKMLSNFSAYQK